MKRLSDTLQAAARNEVLPMPGAGKEALDDPQNLLVEGYISRAEANEASETKKKLKKLRKLKMPGREVPSK
ncbi:hypothetical protein OIU77_001729 [Salix suchowensis]|uniref:Uncharacterized protein n=1 Tax=Salix suchowensis TaxID=1278906 RepID=A0ABQ9B4J5_9ROSI|nr:hypothetical protein OIU77_001729 [Salix suchowensis]